MPKKLERCVKKVKRKGGVKSPWAVCKASIAGTTKRKKGARKKKAKKKKR